MIYILYCAGRIFGSIVNWFEINKTFFLSWCLCYYSPAVVSVFTCFLSIHSINYTSLQHNVTTLPLVHSIHKNMAFPFNDMCPVKVRLERCYLRYVVTHTYVNDAKSEPSGHKMKWLSIFTVFHTFRCTSNTN